MDLSKSETLSSCSSCLNSAPDCTRVCFVVNVLFFNQLISEMNIIHNLGVYAEKTILEWEKAVEEECSTHGGFQRSTNSRTYTLLYELSKLTTYNHGDQKYNKAVEWKAFLKKREIVDRMVSYLHHRFNIIFVLGGAA